MASNVRANEPIRDIVEDHEERVRALESWINRFQGALIMLSISMGTGLTVTGLIFSIIGHGH